MVKSFICSAILFYSASFASDSTKVSLREKYPNENQANAEIALKMDSLFKVLSEEEGFNGNVLIAKEGKIIYENSFGYADLKERTPLNIKSVFEIGSITKQFTAMAIMILHDEGKLDFTDPVRRFIPNFPYKDITIHQLLAHRSGLPEYMKFSRRYWKNKRRLMTNNDLLNIIVRHRPALIFSPDEDYYYSNTGYVVLACIIEHVSGMKYSTFLEKRIFKPLNMRRTFVFSREKIEDDEFPTVGHKRNRRKAAEDYLSGTVGDKGIYSTVEGMLKWDQALYTEKLVRQTTLKEAFTPFSYDWRTENNYGYGWRIITSGYKDKVVYHSGLWRGYSSLFVRRMADKSTVIILCNKINNSYENIGLLLNIIDSSKQVTQIHEGG